MLWTSTPASVDARSSRATLRVRATVSVRSAAESSAEPVIVRPSAVIAVTGASAARNASRVVTSGCISSKTFAGGLATK